MNLRKLNCWHAFSYKAKIRFLIRKNYVRNPKFPFKRTNIP